MFKWLKRKKPLEKLLKEMDKYDWSKVPDLPEHKGYEKEAPIQFRHIINESGVTLEGSVLDVCSGSVSLASIYNNVVCFDLPEEVIKELRKKKVRAVMGDIINGLPFEDKSFDYVFAAGIPLRPLERTDAPQEADFSIKYTPKGVINEKRYIENFVNEAIRVARKKVIINSIPIVQYLPKKHREKIEKLTDKLVVYNKVKK